MMFPPPYSSSTDNTGDPTLERVRVWLGVAASALTVACLAALPLLRLH